MITSEIQSMGSGFLPRARTIPNCTTDATIATSVAASTGACSGSAAPPKKPCSHAASSVLLLWPNLNVTKKRMTGKRSNKSFTVHLLGEVQKGKNPQNGRILSGPKAGRTRGKRFCNTPSPIFSYYRVSNRFRALLSRTCFPGKGRSV